MGTAQGGTASAVLVPSWGEQTQLTVDDELLLEIDEVVVVLVVVEELLLRELDVVVVVELLLLVLCRHRSKQNGTGAGKCQWRRPGWRQSNRRN